MTMQIPGEEFNKFKKIYKEQFGPEALEKKSDAELYESAVKLLRLMRVIYKPMTKNEYRAIQRRREQSARLLFK